MTANSAPKSAPFALVSFSCFEQTAMLRACPLPRPVLPAADAPSLRHKLQECANGSRTVSKAREHPPTPHPPYGRDQRVSLTRQGVFLPFRS